MTNIDFKAEVEARKTDLLADLFSLLAINSERDDSQATAETPFGSGPVAALKQFLSLAERDGYATKNVDNYAGHFTYGDDLPDEAQVLGIFAHMDVVPAGTGWNSNPYEPEIRDGKIYARGSSDDKGPTMACYYGLKILKELNLPLTKKIRFIVGTDEESGWGDMAYYFKHVGLPEPDFGFSPDAEFPIINGEKGNITEYLHFSGENNGRVHLHEFSGGLRENMVPESATAVISGDLVDLNAKLETFIKTYATKHIRFDIENGIENRKIVTLHGRSAHGAMPEKGVNGATYLAKFLDEIGVESAFTKIAGTLVFEDHAGKKLGLAFEDAKMGALSMNAGVFKFDEHSSDNTIALNFRYPQGTDSDRIYAVLTKLSGVAKVTKSAHEHLPHYVPMTDELVSTLLSVYEKQTGLKGHEQIIGGGTFGRLLKRGVAFGAMFPGDIDTMHQANEFIPVDVLLRAAAIYAEAIYELAK
ncbi:dipeptidase PepV [Lactococcus hodotermopsidis]|uniref:Dipeptidase PepV n=1 Tax=Pseudolactococcus hodotermopsidis TaxID=2709157 RepID=A0A6A0BDG1_9LACT|nr:dipeptidase PepV [Lactococcus hodotermopsidis]GFH42705.1 dipeptidase PepV [Lactococcus hodotermopsidis]